MSKKISELTAANPSASNVVPFADPGVATYKTRKDALQGYVSVTQDPAVIPGGADCTAALTTLVAAAAAGGYALIWPSGVYLTSASIPLLHTVRHVGPGAILRGSDTFYLEPNNSRTNRIYMSSTGSTANDGLTSSQPISTYAVAFAAVANYGPMLNGTWKIIVAAGTIAALNTSFTTPSRNVVTVQGPGVGGTPNVPTAFVDGTGAAASDFGLRASGPGVQVYWQDLKFQNYSNGSLNNIALLTDYGADMWTNNVHVAPTCLGQGLYAEGSQIVRITGGVIDGCRQGILLNACGIVTVGYQGTVATQCVVKNCTQAGIEFSRGSEGHIDFVTLQGNAVGVDVFHNARCHLLADAFTSNTVAIRSRTGGYYLLDTTSGGVVFTTNTLNVQNNSDGGESDADLWLSISERRRGYSANSINHTGTVAKTTLLTPWTIPQGFFCTPSANASLKRIRVVVHGQFTTAAALSKIGVDFDAVTIDQSTAVAPGANTKFRYEVEIWADGNAAQYKSAMLVQNGTAPIHSQGSTAQDMAIAARNVNITGQLAGAGDAMRIDRTEVWVSG